MYGPDFPGETFRVLKENEIRKYGEYRTRRLVLEAWDRWRLKMSRYETIGISELIILSPPVQRNGWV